MLAQLRPLLREKNAGEAPTKTKTRRRVIVFDEHYCRGSLKRKKNWEKLCCNFPLCRKLFHERSWSKVRRSNPAPTPPQRRPGRASAKGCAASRARPQPGGRRPARSKRSPKTQPGFSTPTECQCCE